MQWTPNSATENLSIVLGNGIQGGNLVMRVGPLGKGLVFSWKRLTRSASLLDTYRNSEDRGSPICLQFWVCSTPEQWKQTSRFMIISYGPHWSKKGGEITSVFYRGGLTVHAEQTPSGEKRRMCKCLWEPTDWGHKVGRGRQRLQCDRKWSFCSFSQFTSPPVPTGKQASYLKRV